MSVEIHVVFRGKLPGKPALAQAMKELGFPLTIPPPRDSLEKQSGFLPMKLNGGHGGAEFDVFEGHAAVAEVAGDREGAVDLSFDRCANFRFGGDENEMISAMCASAALAKLVGGVVLDAESGELMSVDAAVAWAKKHLGELKPADRKFGTRPSDVKRYLKPLLKLRDDLVLVDRLLLMKPVRHLIRGAYFERNGKSSFRIWSHVNPLYASAYTWFGDNHQMPHCEVWQPHFEPLLIDSLAEDVFGRHGSIVRLNDFADCPRTTLFDSTFFLGANVISLVLAGERDRAAEFVTQYQNDEGHTGAAKKVIQECWDRVSGDIEKVCQECHAYEAAKVKALKLEHVWEPSPFPVELPAAQRARVSEPVFSKTPWVSTPPWLYGEMPDEPGEVRFGKRFHNRDGRDVFVVALTREQAKKRHDAAEPYVRAERLADGTLLQVRHGGEDLNDPEGFGRQRCNIWITWEGLHHKVLAEASHDFDDRSVVHLWRFNVHDRDTNKKLWLGYATQHDHKRAIYDWRSREQDYSCRPLTDAERELVRCPLPGFGDYTELVNRARTFMQQAGFDPWTEFPGMGDTSPGERPQ